MDVSKYPIKWGFGITSPAPWSPTHPHLGVDRPAPYRTPLIVNGMLIGYSGNSGGVAAHHHLQKVSGGKVVDPGNGGFTIPSPATVYAVDLVDDTNIGKAIRIRDAQGVEWSHFHLDEVLVKTGQVIQGVNMVSFSADQIKVLASKGSIPQTPEQIAEGTTKPAYDVALNFLLTVRNRLTTDVAARDTTIAELNKVVAIKDGEIERLKAQVGDSTKWQTLKTLLRDLIS